MAEADVSTELTAKAGRLRPLHPVAPIAGSVFVVLAWAALAHNSGSGWVQALGAVIFAVLLVGLVAPARAVAKASITVKSSPMDAQVGEPFEIVATATSRVRVTPRKPNGKSGFIGPTETGWKQDEVAEETCKLTITPRRRGILLAVTVEVASAAPFGLMWWSRTTTLALPVEVSVAPQPTEAIALPAESDASSGEAEDRRLAQVGETRGVRTYQHGDSRRSVHWRSSAHTGHLMVREMEEPRSDPVTLRVVLPSDPEVADGLASQAMATILLLLEQLRPVMLATHEPNGDRVAVVTGPRDAGRRLARAIAFGGEPGSVTIGEVSPPPSITPAGGFS
jgi:uncharacterized protein (DUF58 family)